MSKPTLNKRGAHHNQHVCWAFVLRVLKRFDVIECCFLSLPSTWLCNTQPRTVVYKTVPQNILPRQLPIRS